MMHRRILNLNICNLIALLFAIYGVYGVNLAFSSPKYSIYFNMLMTIENYLCALAGIAYVCLIRGRGIKKDTLALAILPLSYMFMLMINTYGGYNGDWIVSFLTCFSFCIFDKELKTKTFYIFFQIIIYVCIIAVILQLCYITQSLVEFEHVYYYSDNAIMLNKYYAKFFIFAIYEGVPGAISLPRACGIFNEPGGFGTVIGLLFAATFSYSKWWEKLILFFAGFLTFSFAFYILIFSYLALRMIVKNCKYILGIIPLVVFVLVLPYIDFHSEQINHIAKRFLLTPTGFLGDNRTTEAFDWVYKEFLQSNRILFGMGYGYNPSGTGTSSYKKYILYFGIIGFMLLIGLWTYFSIKNTHKNRDAIILIVLFMASLYQRPNAVNSPMGYILLFGGIEAIIWKVKNHQDISDKLMDIRID